MADQMEELRRLRQQRMDAYKSVISATGWRFVLLDMLAMAGVRDISGDRSAGRYDMVSAIIKRAEGPMNGDDVPEVKRGHAERT